MTTLAQRLFEWPRFVAVYDRLRESPAAVLVSGMTFGREVAAHAEALTQGRAGTFLEIACGQGSFGVGIARSLPDSRIAALDRSRAQLARASTKAREREVDDRYLLVQGDALRLPFGDERFDGTLCVGGLHQMPDPARAIAEMARVVRPGGMVAGGCLVLRSVTALPGGQTSASLPALRGWLEAAGLEVVTCRRTSPIWCLFGARKRPARRD